MENASPHHTFLEEFAAKWRAVRDAFLQNPRAGRVWRLDVGLQRRDADLCSAAPEGRTPTKTGPRVSAPAPHPPQPLLRLLLRG